MEIKKQVELNKEGKDLLEIKKQLLILNNKEIFGLSLILKNKKHLKELLLDNSFGLEDFKEILLNNKDFFIVNNSYDDYSNEDFLKIIDNKLSTLFKYYTITLNNSHQLIISRKFNISKTLYEEFFNINLDYENKKEVSFYKNFCTRRLESIKIKIYKDFISNFKVRRNIQNFEFYNYYMKINKKLEVNTSNNFNYMEDYISKYTNEVLYKNKTYGINNSNFNQYNLKLDLIINLIEEKNIENILKDISIFLNTIENVLNKNLYI